VDLTDHFVAEFRKLEAALRELQEEHRDAPPPAPAPQQQRGPDERDARLAALEGQLAAAAEKLSRLQAEFDELESTRQGLETQLHDARTKIEELQKRLAEGDGPGHVPEKRRGSDQDLIVSLRLELQACKQDNRILRKTSLKLESLVRTLQKEIDRLKGGS
jgi:chromosome segregation ATPase